MANIKKVNWEDFRYLVEKLATKIQLSQRKYDYIIGIPRGGLIPAVMLSHIMDIKLTTLEDLHSDDFLFNYRVLVVDDIADTGNTLRKYFKRLDTATVYCRMKLEDKPTFFAEVAQDNDWIMFPYETQVNDTVSQINMKDYYATTT